MDLKQFSTEMMPSRAEQQTERPATPSDESSGGSWRRRSLIATAALALGLYLRRRRRSGSAETVSDGGTGAAQTVDSQTVDHEEPDTQSKGRSLGRRLVMMALSTLAVTLARRAFRRLRSAR